LAGKWLHYGKDLIKWNLIEVPVRRGISSWALGNGVWVVVDNNIALADDVSRIYTSTGDNILSPNNWQVTYTQPLSTSM
jgi:hypothetical protein